MSKESVYAAKLAARPLTLGRLTGEVCGVCVFVVSVLVRGYRCVVHRPLERGAQPVPRLSFAEAIPLRCRVV